jgi:hypothetical protein
MSSESDGNEPSPLILRRIFKDLENFVLNAPIMSISCVIDRPGYVARYAEKHPKPWLLCQTAFAILIERATKYVRTQMGQLEVFFEEAGMREDRAILGYMKELESSGMPFPGSTAAGYESLLPSDFRAIDLGKPNRVKKTVPMVQLADLVLYAMARGGYDPKYPPFRALHEHRRIVDAVIDAKEIPTSGVKYSCFDTRKAQTEAHASDAACIAQTPGHMPMER